MWRGRWIPAISALRTFQRSWLARDLTSGLVLTAIPVPAIYGIALTVLIGQLPKLPGLSSSGDNLIQEAISLVQGVAQGLTIGLTGQRAFASAYPREPTTC